VVVGSSTINNSVLPTIAPILEDLKGLKFRNKVTGAFGSYGWSGESVPKIKKHLESCGFDVVGDGVAAKWQPTVEDLDGCREYGRKIAEELVRKLAR
jgi:flavorubredoxin